MDDPLFWCRACPACDLLWRSDLLDSPCPNCGHDPTVPQLPAPRRRFSDILAVLGQPPTRLGIVGHWGNLIPLAGLLDDTARLWGECETLAVATGLTPGEVAQIYQTEAAQLPWQITPRQALAIRAEKERRQLAMAAVGEYAKTFEGALADLQTAMEAIGRQIADGLRAAWPVINSFYSDLVRLGLIDPPAKPRRPRRVGGRRLPAPPRRPAWKRSPKH